MIFSDFWTLFQTLNKNFMSNSGVNNAGKIPCIKQVKDYYNAQSSLCLCRN